MTSGEDEAAAFQVVDGTNDVSNASSGIDAPNVVGGHPNNKTENGPTGAFIGGGGSDGSKNTASANYTTIGGGEDNTASTDWATVGGGQNNEASGGWATVGGGYRNTAGGTEATVGGGQSNMASGYHATVGGGERNTASGGDSTVGGGLFNTASGDEATVPGGRLGAATNTNSFVWNDGTEYHSIPNAGDGLNSATAIAGESVIGTNTFHASAENGFRFITGGDSSPRVVTLADDGSSSELTFHSGIPSGSGTAVGIESGTLVAGTSSARYKTNIQPLSTDTSRVLDLEPREFEYEETGQEDTGLIAEAVEETLPELVHYDEEDRPESVQYDRVGVYLVPEVDENRARLDDIENDTTDHEREIANLKADLDARDARIADQQDRIDTLESRLDSKDDRVDALEREIERKDDRVETLEDENEQLRAENEALHERVAAIEAHVGLGDAGGAVVADD